MESARVITSKIYGDLGRYTATRRPNLYRSHSGRVLVLGEGALGGKGEGTLYLDREADRMRFRVPRYSLVICDDLLSRPQVLIKNASEFDLVKVQEIREILKRKGFPARLAIRSSSVIEDKPGLSAAGVFRTIYCGSRGEEFTNSLLWVLNGNVISLAKVFYRSLGLREIPPLPIIIQELVGNEFSYAPRCFFPALAGIMNTASPDKIKIATVPGFGTTAVGEGWGTLYEYDYRGGLIKKAEGELPVIEVLQEGRNARVGYRNREVYVSAADKSKRMRSAVHSRLVSLAARFQEQLNLPLDFEWAVGREGAREPYLLQIRPIQPKRRFHKPAVPRSNVLFRTPEVVGQATHRFSHVAVMDCALRRDSDVIPAPSERQLKLLGSLYPNNIVLYFDNVARSTIFRVAELFPFTRAVVVSEEEYHANHSGPTGLQHIALRCIDENKLLFYLNGQGGHWLDKVEALSRAKKSIESEKGAGIHFDVFELAEPLTIAGSDEDGWGMVYRGEPRPAALESR